jgi:transposase-like protein
MAGVAHGTTPTQSAALSADERHELMELRRKLRQVQMERDILAKATAWFASNGAKRKLIPSVETGQDQLQSG